MGTSVEVPRQDIIGLFPASFDPIHVGHVGVAERAARLLDKLYIAVAVNPAKKYEFSSAEKVELARASLGHLANAEVIELGEGLTVDHARELGATTMIRGARSVTDFLDEIELFGQNVFVQKGMGVNPNDEPFVDTQTFYFLPGQDQVSSTLIRGLIHMPGVQNRAKRIRPLVPDPVFKAILPRLP